jgi:adenylate cyclase
MDMGSKLEIERKFLVTQEALQDKGMIEVYKIQQGYLVKNDKGAVRIRIEEREKTLEGYLMSKIKVNAMSNLESTEELHVETAKLLLSNFPLKVIEKTRHVIMHKDNKWEVDLFKTPNEGLLLAEIELPSMDFEFELPPWVIREVTGEPEYYNANM